VSSSSDALLGLLLLLFEGRASNGRGSFGDD
jgi:hypothetical protein